MKSEELQIPVGYDACVALRVEEKNQNIFPIDFCHTKLLDTKKSNPIRGEDISFLFSLLLLLQLFLLWNLKQDTFTFKK